MTQIVTYMIYVPTPDGDGYLLGLSSDGQLWRGVIHNGSKMVWHPMPQVFEDEP